MKALRYLLLAAGALVLTCAVSAQSPQTLRKLKNKYRYVGRPHDGLMVVSPNDAPGPRIGGFVVGMRFGYADTLGKDVIPVQFDYASDFSQGLALVGIGKRDVRKFGFIDLSGQAAIPIEYDNAELTKEGLLKVMRKEGIAEQWGYLSRDGEVAVPLEYGQLMKPAEGFIAAAKGTWTEGKTAMSSPKFKGKYGFLDYEGNVLIPFDFVDAHSFQNGVAAVAVEGKYYPKWGVIDTCGKTVVPFRYYEVRNFREGLALVGRVIDGEVRYGFISPDGEEVIAAQYASAREFRDGYALVSEFSKSDFAPFYLIDRAGNRRLPYALYDVNDSGRYGHMTAAVPDSTGLLRYGLIDKRGRQIIPFQYDRITIFSEWDAQTQSWKEAGIAEVNGMERSFNIFRNSKK
ncbi:WG repeat-containing protein [Alistipes muris]|uniref:WG repeat-containing protein n=1 Tax=Alistipes muris TaxID=2941326 RepID=UPI00203B3E06|nr:WG repeat-containing protein [Alistipes muris]MCX4281952.1 WG repeat-containing protein [Alistipes sp.]